MCAVSQYLLYYSYQLVNPPYYIAQGSFNHLVFIREIEAMEAELHAAEARALEMRYENRKHANHC